MKDKCYTCNHNRNNFDSDYPCNCEFENYPKDEDSCEQYEEVN